MKKYFLFIVILLLISIPNTSYSECDWPLVPVTFTVPYPIPEHPPLTCNVTIHYCCHWVPGWKLEVKWLDYFEGESLCLMYVTDWQAFMDWVYLQIANHHVCIEAYPPCDEPEAGFITTEVHIAQCHYFENKLPPAPGEIDYFLHLYPCGYENECIYYYRTCYNWPWPDWITEFDHSEIVGTPDCPSSVPELPPQGKTWNEYWITRCFENQCQ
ncbi:MAG: hypothetical protein A2X61_11630 [Ignavibacteria bacterium GWB2_35_12]|nr:MAG: hypothetical protein A2X63_05920 [Ignavibacteria bacterium GWA2_35_8]OGU37956.1 MAG: hypothetical protein A2X61_11630 [Ignavibacteria bacterium GWB2_35_12]OGU85878.1 MAG: hypothetical protein A2220_07430 [Ignavibacteria bacterium RIFOXYA2_FULL_35_10]OGV19716.1 MAG: hypothetical protein A2475_00430 [Ignavibacteria bacterium RIFOXYC2_FULL_35_21]